MWRSICSWSSLVVLLFVAGCGSSKPIASNPEGSTEPPAQIPGVKAADVVVEPADLKEWGLNEKYPDKTLEVTGVIRFVNFDSKSSSTLGLETGPGIVDVAGCYLPEPCAWARLGPGQKVRLHGKAIKGSLLQNFGWNVVWFGPNPCPTLTAKQISEEFAKNSLEAHSRFKERSCYITGKVTKVEPDLLITLEGSDNRSIQLQAPSEIQQLTGSIDVGKTISALCTYNEFSAPEADAEVIKFEALPISGTFPVAGVAYAKDFPSIAEAQAKLAAEMRAATVDHTFEMAELLAEIKKPDFAKNYRQKVIEVTGDIDGFRFGDHPEINLIGEPGSLPFSCYMTEQTPWETYLPGQGITIRGRLPEIMILPLLENAVVITTDPPKEPAKQITAAELLKQVVASGDSFDTDWKGKLVLVTGPLAMSDISEFGSTVDLDAGDEQHAHFLLASGRHAQTIKFADKPAGTQVRLLGKIDQLNDKTLYLREGWIMSEKK